MKFSLITVTYNSESTLCDTIESVLLQSYSNIEYIIIDGLSIDNTVNIIKHYESRFEGRMLWVSEKDLGLYDAMNKGFALATGDVVGIINSDDLLACPTAIQEVMQCFEDNSLIDCVYADLYYVSKQDTSKIIRHWITGKQRSFKRGWHPAHPTFYVKKAIYDKFGTFDLEYHLAADFELMLRLIEKEHISMIYLPKALVRMRLGGATSKNFTNIKKGNIECLRAFKKNGIKISCLYLFYRLLPKLKQYFR